MNDIPKIVFSQLLREASRPTTRIARGDVTSEITAIKQEPGPDVIAWGGARFAAALTARSLIDEFRLAINPSPWAAGRLFAHLPATVRLDLVEATAFDCGVVMQLYRPRPA